MSALINLLQNSWVVGIVGGIVSGIIVYFITNLLYKRKDNSKYLEQIERANTEIIQSIKPYVAEKGLPEKEIIDAIIVSTARKYKVKSEEMYSIRIICEELIREIIENAYVSSEKKREYSLQLKDYLHQLNETKAKEFLITDIEQEIKNRDTYQETRYRQRIATLTSASLSFLAAVLTIFSFFSFSGDIILDKNLMSFDSSDATLALMLVVVFSTTIVLLYSFLLLQIIRKKRNKESDNSESKE